MRILRPAGLAALALAGAISLSACGSDDKPADTSPAPTTMAPSTMAPSTMTPSSMTPTTESMSGSTEMMTPTTDGMHDGSMTSSTAP